MTNDDSHPPEPVAPASRGRISRTPREFGRSRAGAPLEVYAAERPGASLLVLAGHHGDEAEGVALLSAALRMVPPRALAADVVLALNPDGLLRGTRGNAEGVDLNRNFPASNWRAEPVAYRWTVDAPREVALSPGSGPASEPETRALLDLVAARRPAVVLTIHAPLAVIDDPSRTPLGRRLAARTGLPLVGCVGYPTPGSFGTWAGEVGLPVVTWELPDAPREAIVRENADLCYEVLVRGD